MENSIVDVRNSGNGYCGSAASLTFLVCESHSIFKYHLSFSFSCASCYFWLDSQKFDRYPWYHLDYFHLVYSFSLLLLIAVVDISSSFFVLVQSQVFHLVFKKKFFSLFRLIFFHARVQYITFVYSYKIISDF